MKTPLPQHFYWYSIGILLCLVLSILFYIRGNQYENNPCKSTEQYAIDKYSKMFSNETTSWKQDQLKRQVELLKELFEYRLIDYKEDQLKLSGMLQFIMVLLIICILMLFYQPRSLNIPIIGIEIPDMLVYLFVMAGTIYLWVNFTLIMMSTIDSRMTLEFMTDFIEENSEFTTTHYYSNARLLLDQGFTDPWCTYYHNIFENGIHQEDHKKNAWFFLYGIYAPFFGIFYGAVLALGINYFTKKMSFIRFLPFCFVFFSLASTSLGLLKWFEYSAFFFAAMWSVATVFMILWMFLGQKMADKNQND